MAGPLTIVFQAMGDRLAQATGRPLTATSANSTGALPATTAEQVEAFFGERIDLILDSGPAASTTPSTVVDVTGDRPIVVRPGLIPIEEILAVWEGGRNGSAYLSGDAQ
ncbi:MAG: Sua5/YciO/YrdC/YwlC family protein [Proteobacteria bacterium]|nr:Sua5/YciO/YrdC/YwlC family protein [Pseudomonadota bacterium]